MTHPGRKYKDEIYLQLSRIGKAIACSKRLELVDVLCQGPRTVEVLAKAADLTIANTSRHLQVLRSAGLVESRKKGLYVEYTIPEFGVQDFYHALRHLAENRLAEMDQVTQKFFKNRQVFEPVDRKTLARRMHAGEALLIDVRPEEEYAAEHIRGAVSIPLENLTARLAELPQDQEIVAYCRGPYCVLAVKAVELLRKKGFQAVRFKESVYEWKNAGLPITAGKSV